MKSKCDIYKTTLELMDVNMMNEAKKSLSIALVHILVMDTDGY